MTPEEVVNMRKHCHYVWDTNAIERLCDDWLRLYKLLDGRTFPLAPFPDDEPVTTELVERLGWSRIEEKYGMTWRSQQSPQKGTTLQFWPGGHFPWSVCRRTDFGMGIDDVTTFGQLAALCRGLGIPCEVTQ